MFWPDIINLKHFYSKPLGQVVCRRLRHYIKQIWSEVKDETILGIGYTMPYICCFRDNNNEHHNNVIATMPAAMGVIHWPPGAQNRSILTHEAELPFRDNSIDRVLLVHALEYSDQAEQMLTEIWRILTPGGKLLIIAPHRLGIWSRVETSPFSHGHPFSGSQIRKLMRDTQFVPTYTQTGLFFPPTQSRLILRISNLWEKIGAKLMQALGGVLLVEAEKQLYAFKGKKVTIRSRIRNNIYVSVPRPVTPMHRKDSTS